ncbi:spore germination protein (amino acid permease) [Roseburia inulinivorans DSM 16841]|uniref:Spore germination protein (Amino acid permease) n=2 Tax=Roseburia inulinivorans TaxID=360807 RepID=C0FXC1_9FIRM|nr:GerAB/ArcD/ProY family transporter [Roseburia inulinivorans]EEG92781.1 spore germination protein (amino acid permease) [Roseburia inulinivorans DSM 16841]MCC3340588.1 spore germination protein [Roseburia inulinivorans DSM 16841]
MLEEIGGSMFSENNQISGRQVFRLLTYDFLGMGTLLLPTMLADTAGRDGIFCILAGILSTFLYLKLLRYLLKGMKTNYPDFLKQKCGKVCGYVLWGGYFLYFILMASYTAYLFSTLMLNGLVENISFYLVLLLILLLAFYGMAGGIEGRARVYEMLFWFLMIPLFLMLFAACREVKPAYWSPVFVADGKEVLSGSYYVLFCYSMVSIVLFLKEYVADRKKCVGAAEKAVWFSGGVFAALYLILIGLFGVEALAQMKFPAVTMMSRVQVTGGFLKRTDAFMFSIWFFTLYAMLNSMVFYSGNLAEKVIRDCGGYLEGKKRMLPYLILLLLVYGVTVLFYRNQQFLDCVTFLLWKIGTPFVVGVPVLLCLTGRKPNRGMEERSSKENKDERKNHKKKVRVVVLVCFLFGCLFLQGCNVAELEDKAFPVLLNIRDQDDFQNVWLNHEYAGNKEVDYNHLKVVLIERSFLEKEAEVEDMLSMLEQEKEVPWNAYVMTTESCDRLAQTEGELDVLLGNYLEELLENTSGIDQKAYPTLGMLYEERVNHLETLYIPFVDIEGEQSGAVEDDTEKPQITAYEVWKRGRAAGLVDTDTARAAFFTQNFADDYTLQLAPELYVKVDAASCRVKETEKIGVGGLTEQIVAVTVTGEGEILSGTVSASENPANAEAENTETNITNTSYEKMTREKEQLLNTRMEDYLNAAATHALEKEIDITNSYRNLGADNRTWYFKYQNTPAAYEKDIKIQYLVEINWKSE